MRELANELRVEVEQAARRLHGLSEAEAGKARGAGKWVKKEILGHLIDSAANNHQRFVRAQLSTRSSAGSDQGEWVSLHRYRERAWAELVELWVELNHHVAAVIEACPPRSSRRHASSAIARRPTRMVDARLPASPEPSS